MTRRRFDCHEPRTTKCQCARLVEHYGVSVSECFECSSAFDQDPAFCGLCNAGDECYRRCQNKRTWGSCHDDSQRTHWIVGEEPSATSNRQGEWQEQQCVPIRHSNERCFCGLSGTDHANNAGIGAFTCNGGGTDFESIPGV